MTIRERYNELAEYSTTLKYELENTRKQLRERSLIERDTVRDSFLSIDLEMVKIAKTFHLANRSIILQCQNDSLVV